MCEEERVKEAPKYEAMVSLNRKIAATADAFAKLKLAAENATRTMATEVLSMEYLRRKSSAARESG